MKRTGSKTKRAKSDEEPKSSKKQSWGDKNGDGRIDLEDFLIGLREALQWVFSWRGAMAIFGLSLVGSAWLNILSWTIAVSSLGAAAPAAGFTLWAAIQMFEILPIMDDLNIKASLSAMIRRQRKPLEVPVLNETLNPDAKRMQRRYAKREANQKMIGEGIRYAFYALELCVLVLAGNVVNFLGVNWGNILLALVGMFGVEMSLRMFNYSGEQLMDRDEREMMKNLMKSAKRSTMSLE